jgi:hypothetical protein
MKHSDVGTIEVVLNTEESAICSDAPSCGKNKLGLRVATPEFPDACVQRSYVYICVENPIASSLKKPY